MIKKRTWLEGRSDALDRKKMPFVAKAAYRRGFFHGKTELRLLEEMKEAGMRLPLDLRDLPVIPTKEKS